jgi:hypothetical protein
MEIGMMSAEELAKSYSNQQDPTKNQNEPQKVGDQFQKFQQAQIVGDKSAEELAAEFAEGKQKPNSNVDDSTKTEEEKAAEEAAKVQAELEAKKAGRPKTKLDDSFKQGLDKLFKEDKLNPFSDGTETGYIVPETWEDVLEVIDENKKIWEENSKAKDKQELLDELLASKSPAWQFVMQHAETYRDPAELVPLLTAVQNIEYSESLDLAVEADQIKIIKATLSLQGLSASDIEDEVSDLKERGRVEAKATALKPILDKYNESQVDKILKEKEEKEEKKKVFWNSYYQSLENSVFKAKEIDGVKLKNEHKQLIASTLIPDEELGGLPIYTIIDKLVAAGNFKVLSKIALLGIDEKLFDNYFLTSKADKKVDGIQKVLRQSGTSANTSEFDSEDTSKPKPIKRPQYGFFGGI